MSQRNRDRRPWGHTLATATACLLCGLLAGCSGDDDPAAPVAPTAVDRALVLDGAEDSVQEIGPTGAFDFISNTGVFTVEAWFRLEDPDAEKLQIVAGNTFTRRERGFLFGFENRPGAGQHQFRFHQMDGSGQYLSTVFSSADAVTDSEWHHVALIFDGGTVRMLLDGVEMQLNSFVPSVYQDAGASRPLRLGDAYSEAAGSADFYLDGQLDEVRIWSVARSLEQIRTHRREALPAADLETTDGGLRGYWRFDRLEDLGTGTAGANDVRDHSAAGNHGDLAGDAALSDSKAF
jgi:hypothetical protein